MSSSDSSSSSSDSSEEEKKKKKKKSSKDKKKDKKTKKDKKSKSKKSKKDKKKKKKKSSSSDSSSDEKNAKKAKTDAAPLPVLTAAQMAEQQYELEKRDRKEIKMLKKREKENALLAERAALERSLFGSAGMGGGGRNCPMRPEEGLFLMEEAERAARSIAGGVCRGGKQASSEPANQDWDDEKRETAALYTATPMPDHYHILNSRIRLHAYRCSLAECP
eukprot:CAMPEP_0206570722 /NCGR_PEP_ID=MMETSP0325_2-20121206/27204_1 /ASSEMBLY_ACC=CAM_ASM_000347 /TAXON_ID=2866 /ORGANISM="Crypthecodinium cohnii, Strain Seligo" /LENGTH=219 /DNA_ID=CAMNT_0054074559 /DNA_START=115 /DNA_END=772 /DNA_ORIENTATION=-